MKGKHIVCGTIKLQNNKKVKPNLSEHYKKQILAIIPANLPWYKKIKFIKLVFLNVTIHIFINHQLKQHNGKIKSQFKS